MKIRPVGDELFHADGWTDTMKLTVAFRSFAKTDYKPNNKLNDRQTLLTADRQSSHFLAWYRQASSTVAVSFSLK
jgi:hypothetical protein